MNWEAIGAVAEAIGALGVIATLIYLSVQVQQNTKAIKIQTYNAFTNQFREWNSPFRADLELVQQFSTQLEEIESLDAAARQHAVHIFYDFFKLAETLHFEHRMGMIDDDLWSGWESLFRQYLTAPGAIWYWKKRRSFFSPAFADWLESIYEDKPEPMRVAQIAGQDDD